MILSSSALELSLISRTLARVSCSAKRATSAMPVPEMLFQRATICCLRVAMSLFSRSIAARVRLCSRSRVEASSPICWVLRRGVSLSSIFIARVLRWVSPPVACHERIPSRGVVCAPKR
ncbi:hypothetical protein D7Y54_19200 [Stenotrophomonas maltophilia]|nr:hypothetical protein [Stenotrophomonas maltophilia]